MNPSGAAVVAVVSAGAPTVVAPGAPAGVVVDAPAIVSAVAPAVVPQVVPVIDLDVTLPSARAVPPPAPAPPAILSAAPVGGLPLDIETLEEVIGHMLVGDRSIKEIADEYKLDRAQLWRLVDAYRKGGRAALGVR